MNSNSIKIAIVGAGAAGLACACMLPCGHSVTVFEKNSDPGKKLLLSGNGRCNLTNLSEPDEFLKSVPRNSEFISDAIKAFTPRDTIKFFESIGIKTKIESKKRVFPYMAKAPAVKIALENAAKNRGVQFLFNSTVKNIDKKTDGFELSVNDEKHLFDIVIIASGGKSYPQTGSTGDGYVFARSFGHKIFEPRAALTGLQLKKPSGIQGVSLECGMTLLNKKQQAVFPRQKGNLLFTKNGVSGPIIFEMVSKLMTQSIAGYFLKINFLSGCIVPRSVLNWISNIGASGKKSINLAIKDFENIEHATVTRGGVDVRQINPQNMESRLVPGLYFIGEVLDVDALSGGFNLQIAFSTAAVCARSLLH